MLFSQQILELIRNGIGETLCMVIISTVVSYIIGIPLGIILVVTDKEGIRPVPVLQKVLGLVINLLRSVPFLILLIMMIPVTERSWERALAGKQWCRRLWHLRLPTLPAW